MKILFIVLALLSIISCKKLNETTITIWYTPASTEVEGPSKDWYVFDRIKNELNINIELVAISELANADAMILEASDKGKLPDFFKVSHSAFVELANRGDLADVTKYYKLMPSRSKFMYSKESREVTGINRISFGLAHPSGIRKNEGLVIRKDWLDNLGLDVPKTLDELYEVMKQFTYNDPDRNGYDDTYGYGAWFEPTSYEDWLGKRFGPIFGAFGVAGTYNLETKQLNIYNPNFVEALRFINKIHNEKLIDPNWSQYKKDDFRNAWKAGRFGIMREQFAALYMYNNYKKFDDNYPSGEWIVIEPPAGLKGNKAVGVDAPHWTTYAISKKAEREGKAELICKLLEWLSTEGYYDVMYGKEGVNFVFDENGNISNKVPNPELAYDSNRFAKNRQLRNLVLTYNNEEIRPNYTKYYTKNNRLIDPLVKLSEMQEKTWVTAIPFPECPRELRIFRTDLVKLVQSKDNITNKKWDMFLKEFSEAGGDLWQDQIYSYFAVENK